MDEMLSTGQREGLHARADRPVRVGRASRRQITGGAFEGGAAAAFPHEFAVPRAAAVAVGAAAGVAMGAAAASFFDLTEDDVTGAPRTLVEPDVILSELGHLLCRAQTSPMMAEPARRS